MKRETSGRPLLFLLLASVAVPAPAQVKTPLEFEVASVRPNTLDDRIVTIEITDTHLDLLQNGIEDVKEGTGDYSIGPPRHGTRQRLLRLVERDRVGRPVAVPTATRCKEARRIHGDLIGAGAGTRTRDSLQPHG